MTEYIVVETLCLVLKVCSASRTQALRQRHHLLTASTIDWSKRAHSLIRLVSGSRFVDVSYSGWVNFLLQYTPDAVVDWVQVRCILRPQCWRNEVWQLSLQESDIVACSMRQCTVLLNDKTPPCMDI